MELRPLSAEDAELVRQWRLEVPETLRTPLMLTQEMQRDWYDMEICNRDSHTRYWGLWTEDAFVGYGGIEHIEWENRRGEISVLIAPELHGKGYGRRAVGLFLREAFMTLNLEHVWGECYSCGPVGFWEKLVKEYDGFAVMLPAHKYWNGSYWAAYYFDFNRTRWLGHGPAAREEANACLSR